MISHIHISLAHARLSRRAGQVYVDHAGSALVMEGAMSQYHVALTSHVLGNPHTTAPAAAAAHHIVESTRHRLLRLDADGWIA